MDQSLRSTSWEPFWPEFDHQRQPSWPQCPVSQGFGTIRTMVTPSYQPVHRFLQDEDRPFYAPERLDLDFAIQSHPENSVCYPFYGPSYASYTLPPRYNSPTSSAVSSSLVGCSISDAETSWSATDVQSHKYPPQPYHCDDGSYQATCGSGSGWHSQQCIAMHDVQQYPDAQPELSVADEEMTYGMTVYGSLPQEGYRPMQDDAPLDPHIDHSEARVPLEEGPEIIQPQLRTRRPQPTPRASSSHVSSKGRNRSARSRRASIRDQDNHSPVSTAVRAFSCTFASYGCPSTFTSKNEWKRHVQTQHMRLGFWRCDQCPDVHRKPNDFNRKDLFIQHVRRMHPVSPSKASSPPTPRSRQTRRGSDADEEALVRIARRCYRSLRSPPEHSCCLLCEEEFDGPDTWEDRMEHIGKHFEAGKKDDNRSSDVATWRKDEAVEEWLLSEGIAKKQQAHIVLKDWK